jgi:CarD family transcriptional regulator
VKFKVGDKVIYPYHGVAEVTDITRRTIDGLEAIYVVFSIAARTPSRRGLMKVSIPMDRADEVGVREVVSREAAEDLLRVLSATDARVPANWSRRFKHHEQKLKTGDLFQYAEVVRNLAYRQRTTTLAAAEAAMYGTARHLVSTELAVSWSVSIEDAEARMDDALGIAVSSPS